MGRLTPDLATASMYHPTALGNASIAPGKTATTDQKGLSR
jgi:hypothetical protein